MIQDKITEIIVLLISELENKKLSDIDFQNLRELGYSDEEIGIALKLFFTGLFRNKKLYAKDITDTDSFRILSDNERKLIPSDAYGYLLSLVSNEIIDRDDLENILERIFASGRKVLDKDEMELIASKYFFTETNIQDNRIIIYTNDSIN